MAKPSYLGVLYPSPSSVKDSHEVLIRQYGTTGYISEGMIEGCIEFARTEVYKYSPFPTLSKRAAAMIYAFVTFHPFVDGNKRTALMATSYFLYINGYSLQLTEDSPEFTRNVAAR